MSDIVRIDYTSWRGIRAIREIRPIQIKFTSNEWHKEPQWLLEAFDLDRQETRMFAMDNIHSWHKPSKTSTD